MNFFDYLRSWFIWAANVFLNAALDANRFWLRMDWLIDALIALVDFASECAYGLWKASNWYEDTILLLREILSWSTIKSYIRSWLAGIESAIAWFFDWWYQVGNRIDYWWSGRVSIVQGWIDAATQGFDELKAAWDNFWTITWPGILDDIEGLRSEWTNFWSITFPTLVSFTWLTEWFGGKLLEIQALIDSAFTLRESLWAGWQEMRDSVVEFFTDPLKWLYDRVEDFMDRYW